MIVLGILDMLSRSFEQNTILWIVISGVVGAFITSVVKFIFEQTLPEWQQKKASKIAIQKYSFPLLRSAYNLDTTIQTLLHSSDKRRFDSSKDEYFHLKVLYFFGCFLGWCRSYQMNPLLNMQNRAKK